MKSTPPSAAASRSFPKPAAVLALTILLLALAPPGGSAEASPLWHNPRLVISEVHPHAAANGSALETHEWVELRNPERYAIKLNGWIIEDAQAVARLPNYTLAAGATVLVVGSAADLFVPAGRTLIILGAPQIGSGLRNASDRVALIDPYGVRRDAVSWGDVTRPHAGPAPEPGQSITRTRNGGQALSDEPSPWMVNTELRSIPPPRHHPRPDTAVLITKALVRPTADQVESVTIRNTTAEPLLTVNWTLTVGASLVTLRSVRIEPGASFTITESDGTIGAGLPARGGRLILRDPDGRWLATASWGRDHTFHALPAPAAGKEVRFTAPARLHPRTPWWEWFDDSAPRRVRAALSAANIAALQTRQRPVPATPQESAVSPVWISEFYPTAGQGRNDPQFEWFELTNSSDAPVDLNGWTIADNTAADALDGVTIPPNAAIAIGVSPEAAAGVIPAIIDGRIGNGLANAGDQLRLIDPDGAVVSAISWGDDREFSAVKSPDADESINRASPTGRPLIAAPSPGKLWTPVAPAPSAAPAPEPAEPTATASGEDASAAATSADTGTAPSPPAPLPNRSAVAALRIVELLPAPLTGQAEWVEIHNPTDQFIDLNGWALGDASRRTELAGTIAPHSRFVIATQELDLGRADLIVDRIGNGLNNAADTVTLFAPDGTAVHEIRYGDEALPAPDRGLSIALEPERWVVTAQPTPGSAEVSPFLDDAFRSASSREPVSDAERLPVVAAPADGGSDAWMIVSFALIGVIFTLIVRRWTPDAPAPEPSAAAQTYSGPPNSPPPTDEPEPSERNRAT